MQRLYEMTTGAFFESQKEAADALKLDRAAVSRGVRDRRAVMGHLFVPQDEWHEWVTYLAALRGYRGHPDAPGYFYKQLTAEQLAQEFALTRKMMPTKLPRSLQGLDFEQLNLFDPVRLHQ